MDENHVSDKGKKQESNSFRLKVDLSAGNDKIKCYDCTDNNYMFEILDSDSEEYEKNNTIYEKVEDGKIVIVAMIDCGQDEYLQGVKVNLYKINGLSPILLDSKITDERGRIIFSNLSEGCYRVIEIIDKRYFEKPKYLNWNEITIDGVKKTHNIKIVNKIKRFCASNASKHR